MRVASSIMVVVLSGLSAGGGFAVATWLGRTSGTRPDLLPAARGPTPTAEVRAASPPVAVTGRTHPAPGRSATIAPVVLHPVVEVRVVPGDRVKKDQVLARLDDDEARADVRAKEAALAEAKATVERLKNQPREAERAEARAVLASTRTSVAEYRGLLERFEKLWGLGGLSDQAYHSTKAGLLRAELDERAATARLEQLLKKPWQLEVAEAEARVTTATANLESAQAELDHYTVRASLDGVISWLEVNPGTVSRPGTSVWGEILDLREIDVLCELTPGQADHIAVGQAAEVCRDWPNGARWAGRVVSVAVAADRQTGRVPVRVRVGDAREQLRCYVEVTVRFGGETSP
jgi:multidrug resistance efflux pump